jgi:hypothetical protein
MSKGGKRRIDRILAPTYLKGIADAPLETLRTKRDECDEEESVLSYERQLIDGRLRILKAEQERRASGAAPKSLIDRLPEILASEQLTHRGSFPSLEAPPIYDKPKRRVEKLIANDTLARLTDLSDAEIDQAAAALVEAEREVSQNRRGVHGVLNQLIEEVGRRKAGVDA